MKKYKYIKSGEKMKTLDELMADKIMDLLHYILSKFIRAIWAFFIKLSLKV